MSYLSLRDVVVGYDAEAILRGVSLDVPQGSLAAIVGPSGCGKTTLLRTIAGLMRARSGYIRLNGRMVATHGIHLAPEKRRIGWVPQDAALFPHLSVAENVAFGLGVGRRALRKEALSERVATLLELVNLSSLADRTPAQLSGGQAQRVALARALAGSPDLVLFDEPFSALDPLLRGELRADVRVLLAAEGVTGILVTHDQSEALSIADLVAVMNAGEILQCGTPSEIYQQPSTPWVAGFVGDSVFLPGFLSGGTVDTALGRLPAAWVSAGKRPHQDGARVSVLVRPEQVMLTPSNPPRGDGSLSNAAIGRGATVTGVNYTGHDALVDLVLREGLRCTARVTASNIPVVGARVSVTVRGQALAYPDETTEAASKTIQA